MINYQQTHKTTLTLPLSLWHKVQQLVKEGYAPDTDYFIRMAIDLWIDEIIRSKAQNQSKDAQKE